MKYQWKDDSNHIKYSNSLKIDLPGFRKKGEELLNIEVNTNILGKF